MPIMPAPAGAAAHDLFQWLSYLQYPALLVALGYGARSGWTLATAGDGGWATVYDDWNYVLLYAGIGIGLSSLQDPTKTQNEVSKRVWQDPRKGKLALVMIAATTLVFLLIGMYGLYVARSGIIKEVSFGTLMLGLGYMGLLKSAIEMHEHHRIVA